MEFVRFENLAILAHSPLFANISLDAIEGHLKNCSVARIEAGEVLLAPGQENDTVYLVIEGRLRVHFDNVRSAPHAMLEVGDCAGELSLIDGLAASAYVVADENTSLLLISQDVIWSLINISHGIARNMLMVLSGRLRQNSAALQGARHQQRVLQQVAAVDGLTGLHNRRWLEGMFERQVHRSAMDRRPLSLVFMDIDHFKRYNDSYGHLAGDVALCTVARVLAENLRPGDLLARVGGEEFALILPETPLDLAMQLAERLRLAVAAAEISSEDDDFMAGVTMSFGVTDLTAGDTPEMMFNNATQALLLAKSSGRNCVMHLADLVV